MWEPNYEIKPRIAEAEVFSPKWQALEAETALNRMAAGRYRFAAVQVSFVSYVIEVFQKGEFVGWAFLQDDEEPRKKIGGWEG